MPSHSRLLDSNEVVKSLKKNKKKQIERKLNWLINQPKIKTSEALKEQLKGLQDARSVHSSVSTVTKIGIVFDSNDGIIITIIALNPGLQWVRNLGSMRAIFLRDHWEFLNSQKKKTRPHPFNASDVHCLFLTCCVVLSWDCSCTVEDIQEVTAW